MTRLSLMLIFILGAASGFAQADRTLSLDGAVLAGVVAASSDSGMRVDFSTSEAWPNIRWKAPGPNGWDWSNSLAVVITLTNPGADDVPFHVLFTDHDADNTRRDTTLSGAVQAGNTRKFFVALTPRSLTRMSGMRSLPFSADPAWGDKLGAGLEPAHIDNFEIYLEKPTRPETLIIDSIALCGRASNDSLSRLVDRYGQYTRANWPGKINSDADFASQKASEDVDLSANPSLLDLDRWGGWAGGPLCAATGFFRTEQIAGKWWLVDPDGRLFLSMGMDVVQFRQHTTVKAREAMFTWLPSPGDSLASHFVDNGSAFAFLGANLERKYGPVDDRAMGDLAIRRLKSWGFNTLGNWSDEEIGKSRHFPYVVSLHGSGRYQTVPSRTRWTVRDMPDPFDPAFAADVDENVRAKAALYKGDSACLGYFYDNELPWGMPDQGSDQQYALCYGALSLPDSSPAKEAFRDFLIGRYGLIAKLNAAWETKLSSWDDFAAPITLDRSVCPGAMQQDFSDFLTLYAQKYFETVAAAVKRYDPRHLYLGSRFAEPGYTPEVVKAAAKYVDVISFNIYRWNRSRFQFAEQLGKPCLVGEFHFGSTDRGMFSGDMTVKDQQDRGTSYAEYVRDVLAEPAFVGCHWFQYYDEDTLGRSGDGENYNIGFLSITDTPYAELIAAARKTNAEAYPLH